MSVPLDNLYNFLDEVIDHDVLIYRWAPHGSKFLKDLLPLKSYSTFQRYTNPVVICHDQEPLNFTYYTYNDIVNAFIDKNPGHWFGPILKKKFERILDKNNHWKDQFIHITDMNLHQGYILIHSEKNSLDVEQYTKSGAYPVFYWSHAIIAKDWFRYAKIDPELKKVKNIKKDFLIYNRAWLGSREYRLKFSELIVQNNLANCCQMNFSTVDSGVDYRSHQFTNLDFKISTNNLEKYFLPTTVDSNASANYDSKDYNSCLIEVVLETIYDNQKIHLTEKSLRPIACKTPFIILGGAGSLKYLKDYGFRTFDTCWDESYDTIKDSNDRMKSVIQLMKNISLMSDSEKYDLHCKTLEICNYNHKVLFSDAFFNSILNEFNKNMKISLNQLPKSKEVLLHKINDALIRMDAYGQLDRYHSEILPLSVMEKIRNLD